MKLAGSVFLIQMRICILTLFCVVFFPLENSIAQSTGANKSVSSKNSAKVSKSKSSKKKKTAPQSKNQSKSQSKNPQQLPKNEAAQAVTPKQEVSGVQQIDTIVASIQGEPVTLLEVRRHMGLLGMPEAARVAKNSAEFNRGLREFLLTRLIVKEAEAAGISVTGEEVEAYVQEIRQQNRVDQSGLVELLKSKGLTYEQYLSQIRGDILKSRVVSAKVRSQIAVVDEEVDRYVAERKELMPEAGTVRIQQLRVPFSNESEKQQSLAKLDELKTQIRGGAKFEELGPKFTQDLGFVREADLREEISKAIAGLEVGQISSNSEFNGAVYAFIVAGKAGVGSIDDSTKQRIKNEIFQSKFESRLRTFIEEELPKKYQVELLP